jgi:hypothetical protein
MKWFLTLVVIGGICAAALVVPPRTAAKLAARGLHATWDWVASFKPVTSATPTAQKKSKRYKAQAALPQGPKAGRDGIVAQPPKEKLGQKDRADLDSLLSRSRAQ